MTANLFWVILSACLTFPLYAVELDSLESCQFFYGKLLTPETVAPASPLGVQALMPHDWEKNSFHLRGFGTYNCEISFAQPDSNRSMVFPYIGEAFKVWVNGTLVLERGQVADTGAARVDYPRSLSVVSLPDARRYQIVVQVSSFSGAWAGVSPAPLIGSTHDIYDFLSRDLSVFVTALSMLLLFFIFNVMVYFLYERDESALCLAIVAFACISRYAANKPYHILHVIYPDFPVMLSWKMEYLGFVLKVVFAYKLVSQLLRHRFKNIERFVIWSAGSYILMILVTDIGFYRQFLRYWQLITVCVSCVTIVIAVRAIMQRQPFAWLISFGIISWAALSILEVAKTSIFKDGFSSPYAMYGFLIFCFANSYVIALRNAYAFKGLSNQKALSEHAFKQLKKIVYPHQLDLMRRGASLEETMPADVSESFVIAFEIEKSAHIKRIDIKAFLEKAIGSCIELMKENYEPMEKRANAYRIAEIGDGFLCSVGYPFLVPNKANPADFAIELSIQFVRRFQDELDRLDYEKKVFCSIGIAVGDVQGYYPKSGTKEYSVHGRGLILATRYKRLRKIVFSELSGHVIFVQAGVYFQANEELRSKFVRVPVGQGIQVRDDFEATELFYQTLMR